VDLGFIDEHAGWRGANAPTGAIRDPLRLLTLITEGGLPVPFAKRLKNNASGEASQTFPPSA
jgi:hypothetical protein